MKKIFSCSMSQVAVEKWNKHDQKLLQAVEKEDVGKVHFILSKKPVKATKVNPKGQSTFHLAASRGLTDCLIIMLAHGVEINAKNDDGRTALHLAASSCQPECVKLLLQRGADEDAIDFRSWTPLHCAASSGCVSSVMHLCEREDISIDATDYDGKTPLMIAAQRNHPTVCSLLLEHGAQVNLKDKEGRTALILACERSNIQAAEVLLANGANMMTMDCMGHNTLYYADHSRDDALRKLVQEALGNWKRGQDPEAEGSSQETAEVASELHSSGVNQKNWDEDWQALPHEEWRWRYEEEHKKVLYLQAVLMRKTQQLEASAVECRKEKDHFRAHVLDVQESQQGRAEDQPGMREEKTLCHGSSDENNVLDLLMNQEQTMNEKQNVKNSDQRSLWGNGTGREEFEKETHKLVKRYQEEIEHLRSEVATAREEMEIARKRTEELEGHLENMRVVISQFDKRKRTHSSVIKELQDQIMEISGENEKLQELVKILQRDVEAEDGNIGIMPGNIAMTEPTDAQAVLDDVIKELKQLLVQMRVEYANIQWGKQVLLRRQMEVVVKSQPQPELETMIREDFERSATFFKKTVADLEQLLTDMEQKNSSLQEKSKQLQEMTGLSYDEEPVREKACEVFFHSMVSKMQDWEEKQGKAQKQHPNHQRESKGALQENAVLKDIRKLLQASAPGIQDDTSSMQQPRIIQQEGKSKRKIQPLLGAEHESLINNGYVEMKSTMSKRTAELEKEIHDLRLSHAGLMAELTDTGKERDKLQEDLAALQWNLQTDYLPRKDMQSLIEDLEKNFQLLSEELSSEQEVTKKLRSTLEAQKNDILMLKESFPKEMVKEESLKEEKNFSTDVLEELYWNIGTLVKKHDEAVMQKLKLEKENQSLKDDQSKNVSIKDHMTLKIEKQASEIQELSWELSKATKNAERLETELISQKTNSIPKWEHLQQVTSLNKDLTEVKRRLELAKGTVEEKCQEIAMLKHQLDQASEQIKEATSKEKTFLQQHEQIVSSLEKEIQKLKDDYAKRIPILHQNAFQTLMTDKIDTQGIKIQKVKHQLSKGLENAQQLQKEIITQKTNDVTNEKHQEQVTALEKDPTKVGENLDPVRVTIDQNDTMLKHRADGASEKIKKMTSREKSCLQHNEKIVSSSENEIQKLKDDHIECVSILDLGALQTSMTHTIETQATEIQELEHKLTEAMKEVQELQKELMIEKINYVPKKYQQGSALQKDFMEVQKSLQSGTVLLYGQCQEIILTYSLDQAGEVQMQRSMEEGSIQDPEDTVTSLEVEKQEPADGQTLCDIQATVTHKVVRETTDTHQLNQELSESTVNVQETWADLLREKKNYIPYDEHLQQVTALEHALTEVTDELESDKTKLDRQRQEITMLKCQLDQADKEMRELKSWENNCFQKHNGVKSSLAFQVQPPRGDVTALSPKTKEIYEDKSTWKEVGSPEMERNEKEIRKAINMEAMLEKSQQTMDTWCDESEDLSSVRQDRDWKISELLEFLHKCTEELMDLRNRNASFQQRLEEAQQQHEQTVSLYRAHLLHAAQGFMDGDVHSTLTGILQIQSQMVC